MSKKRILIVDDEPDLCDILRFNLEAAGYDTAAAHSASDALAILGLTAKNGELVSLPPAEKNAVDGTTHVDLLLLDVMMPGMDGFELAHRLRQLPHCPPIIFLTARESEDDVLAGFRLGADDYIPKPFSVREVVARVRAVLARTSAVTEELRAQCDGLVMQQADKSVCIDGSPIPFTRTEFELLWLLLTNRGTVFSRQQLLERAWPKDVVVTLRTVDVNITRIRKKIGPYASRLTTRLGFGYSFSL